MQHSTINLNCRSAGVPAHLSRLKIQKRCCRVRQLRACLPPCWSRKSTTYLCFLPNEPDRSKRHSSSMVSRGTAVKGTGTLSVLTLNIWGLWLVSKRRAERVKWVQKASWYCSSCSCCFFTNLACQLARVSAVLHHHAYLWLGNTIPHSIQLIFLDSARIVQGSCKGDTLPMLVPVLQHAASLCAVHRHLSNYLSSCKDELVLLQEVWVDADAQQLIAAAKAAGLVHATHFR